MEKTKDLLRRWKSERVRSDGSDDSLCKRCQKLPLERIFAGNYKKGIVFEEARSIADVEKCFQSCPLCRLVSRSFELEPQVKSHDILSILGLRKRQVTPLLATVKYSVGRRDGETLFGYEKNALRLTVLGRERSFFQVQPFRDGCSLSDGHLVPPVSLNFQLIKAWIANCVSNHGGTCESLGWAQSQHRLTNAFVVDVVDEVLRPLVVPDMKFVALSYVVGKSHRRHRRHLCEFATSTEALPLKDVLLNPPQVVKDTIRLVRMIGERYLWVDCLSISDRNQDHQLNQIRQMHRIYSSALLCIIAADSADGETGLAGISPEAGRIKQLSEQYAPEEFLAELLPVDETALSASIWNSRAWTLQERLLSRRCLIFCQGQVYWRCKNDAFGEDYPISTKPRGKMFVDQMPFRLDSIFPQRTIQSNDGLPVPAESAESSDFPNSDSQVVFAAYCWAVAEYTQRRLTFTEDINTAFRGIEMLLTEHLETTSWWSLPQSLLHRALLWYPGYANVKAETSSSQPLKPRYSRSATYPSWAWCGWIGRITYFSPREYVVTQGGGMAVDLFFSNTKVIPCVAWSRYEGDSRIVINRDHLIKLSGWAPESSDSPEGSFIANYEHQELGRSLNHGLAYSSTEAIESTADAVSFRTHMFTDRISVCETKDNINEATIGEHNKFQLDAIGGKNHYMFRWDYGGYGYLDSDEVLDPADVYVMVVSRAEVGERRRTNALHDWLSRYARDNIYVYDVLYIVFDGTGEFKGRRARRVGIGTILGSVWERIQADTEWREVMLG